MNNSSYEKPLGMNCVYILGTYQKNLAWEKMHVLLISSFSYTSQQQSQILAVFSEVEVGILCPNKTLVPIERHFEKFWAMYVCTMIFVGFLPWLALTEEEREECGHSHDQKSCQQ